MMVEVLTSKTIVSSLEGYAAIITSVAELLAAVGLPKALNNYGEYKYGTAPEESSVEENG